MTMTGRLPAGPAVKPEAALTSEVTTSSLGVPASISIQASGVNIVAAIVTEIY